MLKKKTIIWSAIATLFTSSVLANTVVTLNNTQEFDEVINHHDLVLMKFFAPWCGHCKALIPEYENAAEVLEKDKIMLAEIDCTVNQDVCNRYSLKGYPTLQIFRKGRASDIYPHERTANGIVKFMRKHLSPGLSLLENKGSLDQLKKDESLLVVAYLDPTDHDTMEQWCTFSDRLIDDFAFGYVTNKELAATEDIHTFPSIVLYKHLDHLKDVYEGSFQSSQVEDFIKLNAVPILDYIRPETFMDYVDANRPLVYLFSDSEEMKDSLHTLFFPLAQKYKGKFSFVHIDGTEYASQADFLSLKANQYPAMAIHNFKTGARYPFVDHQENNLQNVKEIEHFLNNVYEEKIEPVIKSQAQPVHSDQDAVKVVVGKDFEEIVMDKSKDVFIEIYAPWCGHCQALASTWQQLGEVMQANDADKNHSLVIAKMDGTINDVPVSAGFQVTGYPTIKIFKAEKNTMVDYQGKRTLRDFVQFLNEQSTKQTLKIDLDSLPQQDPVIHKRSEEDDGIVVVGEEEQVAEKHDEL